MTDTTANLEPVFVDYPFVGVRIAINVVDVNVVMHVMDAEQAYTGCLNSLAAAQESLCDAMAYLKKNIDKAQARESYSINSLGEVQSRGASVDRFCIELSIFNSNLAKARNSALKAGATAL